MFTGITAERVAAMSAKEKRWLDNARKAFHDSDILYQSERPEDGSIQLLCIAVELASKIRNALMDTTPSTTASRKTFLEFIDADIPCPQDGGLAIHIEGWARNSKAKTSMSFADLLYEIRCAYAHEYENLDVAESRGYSIAIDWSGSLGPCFGRMEGEERFVVDGQQLWGRLRELLAKFLTGIAGYETLAADNSFSITVAPPLGAIRNARRS